MGTSLEGRCREEDANSQVSEWEAEHAHHLMDGDSQSVRTIMEERPSPLGICIPIALNPWNPSGSGSGSQSDCVAHTVERKR